MNRAPRPRRAQSRASGRRSITSWLLEVIGCEQARVISWRRTLNAVGPDIVDPLNPVHRLHSGPTGPQAGHLRTDRVTHASSRSGADPHTSHLPIVTRESVTAADVAALRVTRPCALSHFPDQVRTEKHRRVATAWVVAAAITVATYSVRAFSGELMRCSSGIVAATSASAMAMPARRVR